MRNSMKCFSMFICIFVILLSAVCFSQDRTSFGARIPTLYFVTSGVGQSDEGIEPDPYETFSYDLALLDAQIENFNVVYYTSVLPLESFEVPMSEAKKFFHHGAVLETIMAKAGGIKGQTVVAGIGRVWAADSHGKEIGGFAAEYERVYDIKEKAADPKGDAIKQLSKSLRHELLIRGLTQKGDMTFEVNYIKIEKNYGMAIAALGFLNFIYPTPAEGLEKYKVNWKKIKSDR